MKFFEAVSSVMKKTDKVPMEKLEVSRAQNSIETLCKEHLVATDDQLIIEIAPEVMQATISALQNPLFLEKYEFEQIDATCFKIKLRELDLI
jgi:hypothetical protein